MIRCVRVYANGDCKVLQVPASQTQEWVDMNLRIRFGNALFVGTECKGRGYLTEAQCKAISEELAVDNTMHGYDWNSAKEIKECSQRFSHITRTK